MMSLLLILVTISFLIRQDKVSKQMDRETDIIVLQDDTGSVVSQVENLIIRS